MNAIASLGPLCERFALTLAHFVWQGAAIALLAALASALLCRKSPKARYGVHVLALVAMAACLPATFAVVEGGPPLRDIAVSLSAHAVSKSMSTKELQAGTGADEPAPVLGVADEGERPTAREAPRNAAALKALAQVDDRLSGRFLSAGATFLEDIDWRRYALDIALVYFAGLLVMLGRLLLALQGGQRLRRRSEPIEDAGLLAAFARQGRALGLSFPPAVAYSKRVAIPTIVGLVRPMILLPLSLTSGLSAAQVELVLRHELAHIRRYDHWVNVLQRVAEALLFYHPAVWCVSRRIRIEREHCCDDLVLAAGGEPGVYAESLVHIAEQSRAGVSHQARAAVLGATGHGSQLGRRVRRMLEGTQHASPRLTHVWVAALVVLITLGGGMGSYLYAQTEGEQGTPTHEAATSELDAESHEPSNGEAEPTAEVLAAESAPDKSLLEEEVLRTRLAEAELARDLVKGEIHELKSEVRRATEWITFVKSTAEQETLPGFLHELEALSKAKAELEAKLPELEATAKGLLEQRLAYRLRQRLQVTGSDVLVGVSVSVQEAAPVFVEDPKPKKAAVVLDVARPLTKREVKVVLEQAGEACGVSPANITLTTTEGIALHAPPQDISESDAAEGARARRLFPLKHANAKELADGLAEMGLSEVDLAADEASNTLAVSAPVKRMDGIEKLIGMMDTGQRVRSNEVTVFRVDPAERERAAISGLSSEYASERDEQITVDFSEVAERIVAGRGLVDEPTGRVFAAGSTDDVETLIAEVNELLGQLQDEDWWLRKLAVQELASLAEGIASPEFQKVGGDFDLLPRVIDALKDEDARGRAAAAEALGTMGDARAVKYLVAALKEEDAGVREAAAEALARFDDPDVMRYLRYAAQDEYEVLRLGAITALGRIGNKEAVELLLGQFRQAGPEALRRAAVAALAQVPTDVVIEPLTAALRDADEKVVGGAVDALGMVGEEHARRALIVFLDTHSPSEYASWKAIKALAAFAGDDTTQTLVRALRHPSYRVRSEAAQVLERRKYVPETAADQAGFYVTLGNWDVAATLGEAAVPPLEAALEADDREVRNSAARVLGAIGDRAAVKSLCMLLQDESVKVRVAAVEALGHISDPAALEPLIVTLRDSNYEVRMGVARALGRIGHPDAIEPLCAALKDLNGYVRDEAGDVLKGHG